MSELWFQPVKIGNLESRNRFLMAAVCDQLDHDPEARIRRFAALAAGGIGLIVSGATTFSDFPTWRKVMEAVHRSGGKMAVQLIADKLAGFAVSSPDPGSPYPARGWITPLPPNIPAFSEKQIASLIAGFARKAALAREAGADGIEIHAAHSSLPAQFLSPETNRRQDRWGGELENRLRFHREIIRAIKTAAGADFPLIVKLGLEDAPCYPQGLKLAEGLEAARILSNETPADALEISQGLQDFGPQPGKPPLYYTPLRPGINTIEDEAYFASWAQQVKTLTVKTVISTGGYRSLSVCARALEQGQADLIGMCRPFIREAGLVNRWQAGDTAKAQCLSCNRCALEAGAGRPPYCVFNR